MPRVAYSRAAIKSLKRIPAKEAARIRARIAAYAADPASQKANVVKLAGRDGFRLRVGGWRVIFDNDGTVMAILAVGPRGGIYEK